MDYMSFGENDERTALAKRLNALPVEAPRLLDWPILEQHGLLNKLDEIVTHYYEGQQFRDEGLIRLYQNDEVVYKELVVEFLASFEYTEGPRDRNFNTRPSVKFRLCETWVEINLINFARFLGLVDRTQDLGKYKAHLDRATTKKPPTYCFIDLWHQVGMNEHASYKCRSSDLNNPLYRLIHRLNAHTILFHTQPEKINSQHLRGLWYILHPEDRWHLPLALVQMFLRAKEGKYFTLPCGNLVTTIAKNASLLNEFAIYACTEVKGVVKSRPFLVSAMILKKLPGRDKYRVYREGERKDESNANPQPAPANPTAGASSSGSNDSMTLARLVHQTERLERQNLELRLQVNHLGRYMDDLNHLMAHATHQIPAQLWSERTGQPMDGSAQEEEEEDDEDDDIDE